ncbi:outer membrane beta-barrel family protein [uncultured Bacteroides sp.]|uniref:outer membrane beta-barrel family protein n=1 Tax=uncultured Bacteroides sp. TaxID=162156 RepID=UPI002AAC2B73|nr:outer membrane beta-barrel family protein [uncultured Bacteroides sp.]
MKKSLSTLILFLLCIMANAQSDKPVFFTVKGILLDSITKAGEPYSTIRISRKDTPNKPIKVLTTDANGKFTQKITEEGNLIISFTSVGKKVVSKEFSIKSNSTTIDLGAIYTKENAKELKGVEVVAQKPLVKTEIDKLAYNIEDDPDSKTSSTLEMLRKVPMVTVDGEDKIQVNGSSKFKIYINGKPNNMISSNPTEVLKSMPASSIKSIEVITNPGAKYDAEGVSGILNIITVGKGMQGYTATFNAGAGNMGTNAGAYATVQSGKFTVTGNYYYNHYKTPDDMTGYSKREDYASDANKFLINNSKTNYKGNYNSGNMEASYEIDTLRLITFSGSLFGGDNRSNAIGKTEMENVSSEPVYSYNTTNDNKSTFMSINANVDYQRSFRKKEELLTFSYRLSGSPQTSNAYTYYTNFLKDVPTLNDLHTKGDPSTTEHTFQCDFTNPLTKNQTMELGAKYIIRNSNSNDKYYIKTPGGSSYTEDEDISSKYRHLQDILAAYAGYSLKYKSLGFKTGLRYEYTMMYVKHYNKEEDFDAHFSDLVPSANLSYQIGQTKTLKASYNMRISRPGIWYLNPFRNNSDPKNISYGNPNLDSEKSHSFELNYSSFTQKFNINLSLGHTFVNNSIESYSFIKDGVLNNTYENIGKWASTRLSSYINWNMTSKTRVYLNGSGSYNDFKSDKMNISNNGFSYNLNGGLQQNLPWELRLSLYGGGSGSNISFQGKNSGYSYYGFGLNKTFLNKRLTVSTYARNPFSKSINFSSTTETPSFRLYSETHYPQRSFGFSISYRIGELKAGVKKAARSIQNDDVKSGGDSKGAPASN